MVSCTGVGQASTHTYTQLHTAPLLCGAADSKRSLQIRRTQPLFVGRQTVEDRAPALQAQLCAYRSILLTPLAARLNLHTVQSLKSNVACINPVAYITWQLCTLCWVYSENCTPSCEAVVRVPVSERTAAPSGGRQSHKCTPIRQLQGV